MTRTFEEARSRHQKARAAGMDPDYWYPAAFERDLPRGKALEVRFWNRSIALFRGSDGRLAAIENRCAHRQLDLTLGRVEGCELVCLYHGWAYDAEGRVARIPHDLFGRPMPNLRLQSFPLQTRYGIVWMFPGDPARAMERSIPDIPELEGPGRWGCAPLSFTWRAHHSMIIDNVSDFTHAYLHRRYQPFSGARLTRCEVEGDRVYVDYDARIGGGRFSRFFVDRNRVKTDAISLCYDYPYQWSNTGGRIKHWCFLLPQDAAMTRVFFLFYFDALRFPGTPIRLAGRVADGLLWIAKRLLIQPLLEQDGFAVEAEQAAWERHGDAPIPELNPAVGRFQELTIRKWEEHLSRARS